MKALLDFVGAPLTWVEPKAFQNIYELRSEKGALVASLSFRSTFGTLAVAETGNGDWSFKRVGFLNPRVTVRVQGAQSDLAVYHPKLFGGGQLVFADGATLHWHPANAWQTQWAFCDSEQNAIVQFAPGPSPSGISDLFKTQATVTTQASALRPERVAMLASLGFYLIVLHQQDSVAAASAAATAASS